MEDKMDKTDYEAIKDYYDRLEGLKESVRL